MTWQVRSPSSAILLNITHISRVTGCAIQSRIAVMDSNLSVSVAIHAYLRSFHAFGIHPASHPRLRHHRLRLFRVHTHRHPTFRHSAHRGFSLSLHDHQ